MTVYMRIDPELSYPRRGKDGKTDKISIAAHSY